KAIYGKSQQSTIECHEPIISSCEANELAGANGREVGWMGKKHEPTPSESRKPNGPPVERASKSGATSPILSVRMRSIESRLEITKNLTSCAAPAEGARSITHLHNYTWRWQGSLRAPLLVLPVLRGRFDL